MFIIRFELSPRILLKLDINQSGERQKARIYCLCTQSPYKIGNNKFMQKIQSNIQAEDLFCPWDDDREMELVGITASLTEISKLQNQKDSHLRTKKAEKEQPTKIIEDQAKKALLHIDEHEKNKKMQLLKDQIDKKKESSRKKENELPQGLSSFRLPPINSRKHTRKLKQNSKKFLQETVKELSDDKREEDNEEEQIFRKYGEHKKRQKANSVQRSYSLGNQPFKILHQVSEVKKKYQTLDVSTVREKKNLQLQLGELQLKGKKYTYQMRSKNKREEIGNYLPAQPNITPHYMLFGHNKEDILKKVLQQLHHKFKDIN